jgi:bifunctional non-homologous end joining protein LigD
VTLKFIEPSQPVLATAPPMSAEYLHELKWDGYRCQVHKEGRQVTFLGKSGRPLRRRYHVLEEAAAGLPCRSAIIDAEIVGQDDTGRIDFPALHMNRACALVLVCFDLMMLNGADQRELPLTKRRAKLERLLDRAHIPCVPLSRAFDDPIQLMADAERLKLEGIVSKLKTQRYLSGKNRCWVKCKTATWRTTHASRWKMFKPS